VLPAISTREMSRSRYGVVTRQATGISPPAVFINAELCSCTGQRLRAHSLEMEAGFNGLIDHYFYPHFLGGDYQSDTGT
jgi:hypothetical protein